MKTFEETLKELVETLNHFNDIGLLIEKQNNQLIEIDQRLGAIVEAL